MIWFELRLNDEGQFPFSPHGGNGETNLRSERYDSKTLAENGVASVQNSADEDARCEPKDASDGRFCFKLKAGNHQVIGTRQAYKTAVGRHEGIAADKGNGPMATVKPW